jgi:hypothetical protein
MSFLRGFVRRPQRVWLRRLSFQLHLWIGLILTVYWVIICLTGSILVFREELEGLAGVNPWRDIQTSGPYADPVTVISTVRTAFPEARIISLSAPTKFNPVYTAVLQNVYTAVLQNRGRAAEVGVAWSGPESSRNASVRRYRAPSERGSGRFPAPGQSDGNGHLVAWAESLDPGTRGRLRPHLAARQLRPAPCRGVVDSRNHFLLGDLGRLLLDGRAKCARWLTGFHPWSPRCPR